MTEWRIVPIVSQSPFPSILPWGRSRIDECERPGHRPAKSRSVAIPDYFNIDSITIATMTARTGSPSWVSLSDSTTWVSRLVAADVTIIRTGSPNATIIAFQAHNEYLSTVTGVAYAVYRDAAGTILGSSHVPAYDPQYFPPGTSQGSITVTDWFPSQLDDSRTEIYLTRIG